jgi:hypothetical protein
MPVMIGERGGRRYRSRRKRNSNNQQVVSRVLVLSWFNAESVQQFHRPPALSFLSGPLRREHGQQRAQGD